MEPPRSCSIIMGAAALSVFHTPVRLISMRVLHCSSDISQNRFQLLIAALATTTSIPPNSAAPS
jgi:hypothetical protein